MIRVLIADDHGMFRDALKAALLAVQAIEVVAEAADGRDAVVKARMYAPDVILMDISMPILNGIDAVAMLRRLSGRSRVIMLSMHAGADYVSRAFAAGADSYVTKDRAVSELVTAIKRTYEGERFVSSNLEELVLQDRSIWKHADPINQLTARERQVLQLVVEGRSSCEIAVTVNLSPKSIDTYRSRLMKKLGVHNVVGLVKTAIRHGFATAD